MHQSSAIVASIVIVVVGCGTKEQPLEDKVTYVADDDTRMNAAIDKAHSTVDAFIAALKMPKPSQSAFAVKMPFTDGGKIEHIWLSPVTYDGSNFHGTVSNEPEDITTVKLGQEVSVSLSNISDWMYIEDDKLVGGETLRVLRDTLSPAERAEFDKSVPFVVD